MAEQVPNGDGFDPEAAERSISEFIDSAGSLPGPPVAELADLVAAAVREAWDRVEGIMSGQRHNKVLAVQLPRPRWDYDFRATPEFLERRAYLWQRIRGMVGDQPEFRQARADETLTGMVEP